MVKNNTVAFVYIFSCYAQINRACRHFPNAFWQFSLIMPLTHKFEFENFKLKMNTMHELFKGKC